MKETPITDNKLASYGDAVKIERCTAVAIDFYNLSKELELAANEMEEALKPVEDVTEADENGHQVELFLLGKEIRAIHAALARFRALKPKGGER